MNRQSLIDWANNRLDELCNDFTYGKPDADDVMRHARSTVNAVEYWSGLRLEIKVDSEGNVIFE